MLPEVNLLPEREQQSNTSYHIFLISIIVCVLLYSLFAYFYFTTSSDLKLAEQRFNQLEMEKTALETKQSQSVNEDIHNVDDSIRFAEYFVIPTSHFIDELLDLLPEHAYLTEYEYNFRTVKLKTQFETLNDASSYTDKLVQSKFITEAMVDEIDTIPTEELEDEDLYSFDTIPRYDVSYSLVLNLEQLKQGGSEDE